MSSEIIDTNIVEIQFDGRQFIENVSETQASVERLKDSLQFDSKSFDALEKAANNIDLSKLSDNIESLSDRFSTFGIIGMTAIQRITNEVITLGGKLVGLVAKPWQQIITGGTNRAANIAKARFQLEGIFGKEAEGVAKLQMAMDADAETILKLTDYTEDMIVAMDAANYAVADTAYGLDSAAKAASVLATSGVDVTHYMESLADSSGRMRTEMQVALRAISGVSAMASVEYDRVAEIFERISGNGRVMARDWQSFASLGIGAAAVVRDYLNEIGETSNATEQDIRDMASEGKISFNMLAMAMDSAYGDHAKDANNTFTGALSNMKFALSKIGADFIGPLRTEVTPLFNDLRLSINNVRKALNFKMKFPNIEEEISIVEAFTRVVHNLTVKLHDLAAMWMGGQDSVQKAITGLSEITGIAFEPMKRMFEELKNGSKTVKDAINELSNHSEQSAEAVNTVLHTLGETLEKTDDEIREMCENGEISFEQFSNAASSSLGNTVWDKRVSQLSTIFLNLILTVKNLGNTIASFVGPVVTAFFEVFLGGGIDGIIGVTNAMQEFTSKLKLSMNAQKSLHTVAVKIFRIIKHITSFTFRLVRAIVRLLEKFAPLIDYALEFMAVLATIAESLVDVILNSNLLTGAVEFLGAAFRVVGGLIVNLLRILVALAGPVFSVLGKAFSSLAKGIMSIDLSFLNKITEGFGNFIDRVLNNGLINGFLAAFAGILLFIERVIDKIVSAFTDFHALVRSIVDGIVDVLVSIATFFVNVGNKIKDVVIEISKFIVKNFLAIVAIVQEVILFSMTFSILRFGSVLNELIESFAAKNRVESIKAVAQAIKSVGQSILMIAAAAFIISHLPDNSLKKVLFFLQLIFGMVTALSTAFMVYRLALIKLRTALTKEKALANLIEQARITLEALKRPLKNLVNALRISTTLKALAILVIGFAAALFIFGKALKQLRDMEPGELVKGLVVLGVAIFMLTKAMNALQVYAYKSGFGMMGASIAMLAFIVVLKAMVDIIKMYSELDYGFLKSISIFFKMTASLAIMVAAVTVIGTVVKNNIGGLIGASVAMLGFLVVLKSMEKVLLEYAEIDWNVFISSMIKVAAVMIVFVNAVNAIAETITGESSFIATLTKKGLNTNSTRKTKQFIGAILLIFSIVILMKQMAKVVQSVAENGFVAWLGTIGILITTMYGIAEVLKSATHLKDSKAVIAMILAIGVIATSLLALTLVDSTKLLAASASMGIVLMSLSTMMKAFLNMKKGRPMDIKNYLMQTILPMISAVIAIGVALMLAGQNDWKSLLAASFGMSSIILSLAAMVNLIQGTKLNYKVLAEMVVAVIVFGGAIAGLAQVPVPDPKGLMTLVECISVMAIVMSVVVGILGMVNASSKASGALISLGISLSVLAIGLAAAGNIFKGSESGMIALATGLLALTPLIFVLSFCVGMLSSLKLDKIGQGSLALFAVLALIGLFAMFMAHVAKVGNVFSSVYLLDNIGMAMLKMVPAIMAISVMVGALGAISTVTEGVGAVAILLGLGELFLILKLISNFVENLAKIAQIGNVASTVVFLSSLGMALKSMIPFIVTVELLCTLLGAAAPIMGMGIIAFRSFLNVIVSFVSALNTIALYNNVANTVSLMIGLSSAMNSMKDFIIEFMTVLTIIGALGVFTATGLALFALVLTSMVTFVYILSSMPNQGAIAQTITTVNTLVLVMHSLAMVFMEIMEIGVGIGKVLYGITAILGSLGLIGLAMASIGAFTPVTSLAMTGVQALIVIFEGLRIVSEIIGDISINAMTTFVNVLAMVDSINVGSIVKLVVIASGLFAAMTPIASIGTLSQVIAKGINSVAALMASIKQTLLMANELNDIKVDGLIDTADQLLRLAVLVTASGIFMSAARIMTSFTAAVDKTLGIADKMIAFSSQHVISGLNNGLTSSTSKKILALAGAKMAVAVDTGYKKALRIESPSKEEEYNGEMTVAGIAVGMTNTNATDLLNMALGNVTDSIVDGGTPLMEMAGQSLGASLLNSLGITLDKEGLSSLSALGLINDNTEIAAFLTGRGITGSKNNKGTWNNSWQVYQARLRLAEKEKEAYDQRVANNIANYQNEKEYLAAVAKEEEKISTPKTLEEMIESMSEGYDWGNFMDDLMSSYDKDGGIAGALGDMDLSSAIGSIGDSAGSSSQKVDELTNKLDGLMEEYENLWDNAKKNANKDLFKGVEDQGDDFLDSIKDIMKQYEDIYKTAVERTNDQNLFAEVNENDESFAPDTLLRNLEDQVNQVNELNTIIASLSGRITDNNLRAAIANMDVDDLPQLRAMYRMNESQLNDYQKLYQDKVNANQNKIQNELSGSLSQLTGHYTNVAEYIATDASTNQLVANLQSQIDQLNEYNATVGSLMLRIKDMNLREAIAHMGTDSLAELKMLNSMTDAQLDAYTEMYNQKIAREAQALRNELSTELSAVLKQPLDIGEFYEVYKGSMGKLKNDIIGDQAMLDVGSAAGTTLGNGMSSTESRSAASVSGTSLANSLADGVGDEEAKERAIANAKLVVDSILLVFTESKKDFTKVGADIINAICSGMDLQRRSDAAFGSFIYSVMNDISDKMNSKLFMFEQLGQNIVYGIQRGINEKMPIAVTAATNLAIKTYSSAAKIFESHSPSRLFMRLGRYLDEGLAIGIKDYTDLATDEASDMSVGTVSVVSSAIQQLSGMLDGSIDINPVITPTLDLSQINARSAALANMFNGRQIAVQARADEQQAEMMTQLGNILAEQNSEPRSVTFNQTNNSPKALSRTEIYRQTRNGFSQLVSALS